MLRLLALALLTLLALPATSLAVTFADGGVHVIDASNSCSAPGGK